MVCRIGIMALRYVEPLSEKQWKFVTDMLAAGPTDKSIAAVKDALSSKIKER